MRFDGMLLVSDFDNTLLYTERSLLEGAPPPAMPERNLSALRRWMDQGGRFAVATGRAMAAFRPQLPAVPCNAPIIVDNGGTIYDFAREACLWALPLPEQAREHIAAVLEAFPGISIELYHPAGPVQVVNPSRWNDQHAKLTGAGYETVAGLSPEEVSSPLSKALFVAEGEVLTRVQDFLTDRGWGDLYELIFSSGCLLEMTARGANKGGAALRLKALLGCEKLFCVGDHLNDLPMLAAADRSFAPANAVPEVLASGAEVVCHCLKGAVGDAVERLERDLA